MLLTRTLASSASLPKKTVVQLFFDIISPYTYIQFELLIRQRAQWQSMSLKHTPVAIIGVMQSAGNKAPMLVPAKAMYMIQDLSRLTEFHKVSVVFIYRCPFWSNQLFVT